MDIKTRIDFEADGVEMPPLPWKEVRQWIMAVAESHGFAVGRLLYTFLDDEGILRANIAALGHDYYTDIITFDYTRGDTVNGEILVSLDTVATNAEKFGQPQRRELLRVIIHGVLHLCGINDKGPGEREIMERCEDEALAMCPALLLQ